VFVLLSFSPIFCILLNFRYQRHLAMTMKSGDVGTIQIDYHKTEQLGYQKEEFDDYNIEALCDQELEERGLKQKLVEIARDVSYEGDCPDEVLLPYFERDAITLVFTKKYTSEVAGFAQLYDLPEVDAMWHSLTCVLPEHQGHGIDSQSLEYGIKEATKLERKYQVLNSPNPRAIEIAGKVGFEPTNGEKIDLLKLEDIQKIVQHYKGEHITLTDQMVLKGNLLPENKQRKRTICPAKSFDYSTILDLEKGDRLVMFKCL
jgi:GNAT superfamily N-acetyltransferase